jgi:hypothetical protein
MAEFTQGERRDLIALMRSGCWCGLATEFWDDKAIGYADRHLEEVGTRAEGWEVLYRCPTTGTEWMADHPLSEEHGGGPRRLRQVDFKTLGPDGPYEVRPWPGTLKEGLEAEGFDMKGGKAKPAKRVRRARDRLLRRFRV